MSPHALDQSPPDIARWWLIVRNFHPKIHINKRSRDKLKTYFHYHNAYGQKKKGDDMLQGAPTHKFA